MKKVLIRTAMLFAVLTLTACGNGDSNSNNVNTTANTASNTASSTPAKKKSTQISIGTGGVTGVYYPTGGAICQITNATTKDHGVRCSIQSTAGSVSNLNMLRKNDLSLGIAQSDMVFLDLSGKGPFASQGPDKDLQSVFSLYPEALTIVARADANIHTFDELKNKRVNIGSPGSAQNAVMSSLMELKGWSRSDLKLVAELKPAESAQALCDNKIDAMAYFVGQPSGSIMEATTSCDAVLVNVNDHQVKSLMEREPYLMEYVIPGGMYRNNNHDVTTIGTATVLVTSKNVDDEAIYQLVRSVFENLDTLRRTHPSLSDLKPEKMVQGNLAPLHPGAKRYFIEAGLMK